MEHPPRSPTNVEERAPLHHDAHLDHRNYGVISLAIIVVCIEDDPDAFKGRMVAPQGRHGSVLLQSQREYVLELGD